MNKAWHVLTVDSCTAELNVEVEQGLSQQTAQEKLAACGRNQLQQAGVKPWWLVIAHQLFDFMILILLAAALISGIVGELSDTLIILVIVALNASLGAYQEIKAEKAIAALRAMASQESTVKRSSHWVQVASELLVPGDIIRLEAGNIVPADLRLIEGNDVEADESSLTGESLGVSKTPKALCTKDTILAERKNMLYKGTQINRGTAIALVVETGMHTELGHIAALLERAHHSDTPLQARIEVFSKRIALCILAICLVVFLLGVARGEPLLLMLLTGISLAVAAIPEALPAIISIALALGAAKMSRNHALMRNLSAVETLGSVTYICADKTGTLTQNRMHADALYTPDSYPEPAKNLQADDAFILALALNNDVYIEDDAIHGEPTERALYQAALNYGADKPRLEHDYPRSVEIAFNSERKRMSTLHPFNTNHAMSFTKGAPEAILPLCYDAITDKTSASEPFSPNTWLRAADKLAAQGFRVLAVACRRFDCPAQHVDLADLESGLSLLGLVALIDPPRAEAKQAITECLQAGITPIMITGDHPSTAHAIAKKIELHSEHDRVITGAEMATMSEQDLQHWVKSVRVYARVSPEQKVRLVNALKANGEFCAMTGDGVNDAPALKNAHIGISMGERGTDVAREASDMILLDDNFATIITAVKEGRRIFDNIRRFIKYVMTGNSGEIWVLLLAPLLGMPIALLPIHILWVNLVTDGLPGLALSVEPAEQGVMQRPPRAPDEKIFAHGMWQHILAVGLLIGGLSLWVQYWALSNSPDYWQTMVFTTLTLSQLVHVLAIRSERQSLFHIGLFSNPSMVAAILLTLGLQLLVVYLPFANNLFKTSPLPMLELGLCFALASVVLFAVELEKLMARKSWIYS